MTRFIHLMRHPVDVIKSGIRRKWYEGHLWDGPAKSLPELWRFLGVPPLANPQVEPWNAGPRYGIDAEFEPFLAKIGGDVLRRSGYRIHDEVDAGASAKTPKEMAA